MNKVRVADKRRGVRASANRTRWGNARALQPIADEAEEKLQAALTKLAGASRA